MQKTIRARSLLAVASAVAARDYEKAMKLARDHFNWSRSSTKRAAVSKATALRIFKRDRFVDRYSGSELIYPGALLALGLMLPDAFPMHPTWQVSSSHEIFWELWPVIDHVVPVTRHGSNDLENLVTTSAVNNCAKGAALLDELGWTLLPIPEVSGSWDGLIDWFLRMVAERPALLDHAQLRGWHRTAINA